MEHRPSSSMMKERLALTSRARPKEDVVFRDLEGEIVLLNLETGIYFGLNPLGTRIWHLIRAHRSLQQVLDSVVEEYEVTTAQCGDDLLRFVALLREKGLIELSN